jgi:bacillithiol biosynthesis cysteine-adding enzyme BshC
MLQNALREYRSVSADPILTAAEGPPAPALFEHGTTRTGIDVRRLPWMRPLLGDYAFDFSRLDGLYPGNPATREGWQDVLARVRGASRDRDGIVRVLTAQQERRGAPPEARQAAARLADPGSVAIVTGQQAGILGGPMYTLLKAVTALQLARRIAADFNETVVPVFWVDAEDHDWTEIASCTVLGRDSLPCTISSPALDGAGHLPVGALTLDDSIINTLQDLADAVPETDFTPAVLASLRAAYVPGRGVGEAFARWIEDLLGPQGLVVFESSDRAAKPLVAEVFAREIETAGRTAALAAEGGRRMAAAGHTPQVEPQSDAPALFHLDGGRIPIRRDGDVFIVEGERRDRDALVTEARQEPWHFSPNVLLRPVVQDTLFPTIAYVAGPSELAYWGQLRGVYEHFGRPMPLVYPRATATLVDAAAARFFRKHRVRFEDLQPQDESALNRLLHAQLPESVDHALQQAGESLRRAFSELVRVMPEVDPTLAGAAQTTQRKLEHELEHLQNKVVQAAKRRDDTLRRQFIRVQAQTFPNGHPQERVLGIVTFTNLYGPALVERLLAELPLDLGYHWVITI